uniref:(northern house mosquito) hypothetical protein n=1 Tax=Culex pipiens TaxID=7175 RepID=A0A8D8FRI3_CULPI
MVGAMAVGLIAASSVRSSTSSSSAARVSVALVRLRILMAWCLMRSTYLWAAMSSFWSLLVSELIFCLSLCCWASRERAVEGGVGLLGLAWQLLKVAMSQTRLSALKAVKDGQVKDWKAPLWGLHT